MEYIWDNIGKIAGFITIALFLWGIFKWPFSKKETKPNSDDLVEITPEELKEILITDDNANLEVTNSFLNIPESKGYIADFPKDIQKIQIRIGFIESVIEDEADALGEKKLAESLVALTEYDFSKVDKNLTELEKNTKLTKQTGSRLAIARGVIAELQNRWHDAAKHHARGAQLYPCFETLSTAQKIAIDTKNYDSALFFSAKTKKAAIAEEGKNGEKYAQTLGNLGEIYRELGKYEKALCVYLEIIDICNENLQERHPLTIITINNMGLVYQAQENYTEAESCFNDALDAKEHTAGINHLETASIINNLAIIYLSQERYEEAELFFKRAIKIRNDGLEKDSFDNAVTFNNLAGLYERQGRYNDAESYYHQAVKLFDANLGSDNANTKKAKANYETLKKRLTEKANAKAVENKSWFRFGL